MKEVVKRFVPVYAVLFGILIFFACNNDLQDSPRGEPAITEKALSLKVSSNTMAVQGWTDAPTAPEKGGWYEEADKPQLGASVDYSVIDPKNSILVTKVLDAEQGEVICTPDEFTVVVLKNTETMEAAANTKLESIGYTHIQVFLKTNKELPVHYYNADGQRINDKYLTVMVTSPTEPDTAFTSFSILKKPVKNVYDWEENFEVYGLEVLKWYGGSSFEDGGTPVLAQDNDYAVDFSQYSEKTRTSAGIRLAPQSSYDPIPIYVKKTQDDAAGQAVFTVDLKLNPHKVTFKGPNDEPLSGGSISFHSGGPSFTARQTVTLNFTRNSSYNLNADSVCIRYGETEIRPGFLGVGSGNQLNFKWDLYDTDEQGLPAVSDQVDQVAASFEMPRTDVTVIAEYVYASTKLSKIEVKPVGGGTWEPLYGFSPNIAIYDYVLPLDSDSLEIKATTSAEQLVFDHDRPVTMEGGSSSAARVFKDIGYDGVIVSITASTAGGSAARVYMVRVKRFNTDTVKKITYNFTGNVQTFFPPVAGYYKFTAWGGDGGDSPSFLADMARYNWNKNGANGKGGRGGKVSGTLYMDPNANAWQPTNNIAANTTDPTNVVYIYVGEGGIARTGNVPGRAAWNGGSRGGYGSSWGAGSGGAGATSISLTRGSWADWQVLLDRIMVAGGGGGYSTYAASGGAGGGLIAQGGRMVGHETIPNPIIDANLTTGYAGTSQVNGFWTGAGQKVGSGRGGQSFGIGGTPPPATKSGNGGANEGRGGGGGGYFGGEITWGREGHYSNAGGGGGSGYVSGYPDCVSYGPQSASTWMVPVGTTNPLADTSGANFRYHYSGRAFNNPDMFNLSDLAAENSGPQDSPIPDPFGGLIGTDGLSSRHGVLVIEYIGDVLPGGTS